MACAHVCCPASTSTGHWFENFENQMNKMQQTFLKRSLSSSGMEMPLRVSVGNTALSWKLLDTIEPFRPEDLQITIAQDGKSITLDAKSEQTTSDGGKISRAISKRWAWTEAVDAAALRCYVKDGTLMLEAPKNDEPTVDTRATTIQKKVCASTSSAQCASQQYVTVSVRVGSAVSATSSEQQSSSVSRHSDQSERAKVTRTAADCEQSCSSKSAELACSQRKASQTSADCRTAQKNITETSIRQSNCEASSAVANSTSVTRAAAVAAEHSSTVAQSSASKYVAEPVHLATEMDEAKHEDVDVDDILAIQTGSVANARRLFEDLAEKERKIRITKVDANVTEHKLKAAKKSIVEESNVAEIAHTASRHQAEHENHKADNNAVSQRTAQEVNVVQSAEGRQAVCEETSSTSTKSTVAAQKNSQEVKMTETAQVASGYELTEETRKKTAHQKATHKAVDEAKVCEVTAAASLPIEQTEKRVDTANIAHGQATVQNGHAAYNAQKATANQQLTTKAANQKTGEENKVTEAKHVTMEVQRDIKESVARKSSISQAHELTADHTAISSNQATQLVDVNADLSFLEENLFPLENQFWENRHRALRQFHETSEKLQQEYLQSLHWPNIFEDSRIIRSSASVVNSSLRAKEQITNSKINTVSQRQMTTDNEHVGNFICTGNGMNVLEKKVSGGRVEVMANGFGIKENYVTADEFKVALDVAGCPVENLSVRVVEETRLVVEARWSDGFTDRLARREWKLPQRITEDSVKCTVTSDGILVIRVFL